MLENLTVFDFGSEKTFKMLIKKSCFQPLFSSHICFVVELNAVAASCLKPKEWMDNLFSLKDS